MGRLSKLYNFITKLNKKSIPYCISDEVITLTDGKWEGFLNHDNVNPETIEIYTSTNRSGSKVLNYTVVPTDETWRTYVRVFHSANTLYVTYETTGDTVEADDINNLQLAIDTLDVELEGTTNNLKDHVSNSEIHITKAERTAWNDKVERVDLELTNELLNDHKNNKLNPHNVTKEQLQLERVDNVQQASKEEFILHRDNNSNPHNVTKDQVGLSNVDNIKQASKVDFDNHVSDMISHITSSERNSWNDKYTKSEVDNKLATLETKIDWKESVNTFDDIATTYPSPVDGWTVNVKDTDYTYRYSGSEWVVISANAIPKATTSVDGLLSKEDKAILDDVNSKKHTHSNKSVIDTITSALITNWNSAFTHISDTVKHITSDERTLWNTVSNKVDKETGKGLSTNDFTTVEKNKLAGVAENANNYVHPSSHSPSIISQDANNRFVTDTEKATWNAKASTSTATTSSNGLMSSTDKSKLNNIAENATKTEASTTNGKIKINGTETTVYTHPTGTNPHGTTKADVGLGNVDNTSDLNKPISTAVQTALNGKANSSHTHSQYVTKDDLGEAGYGDMLKSVYDTNNSGVVDKAESVAWTGVTGKPSTFPPSSHTHTKSQITDFPTSLPANGGNADTVDGFHASDFATTSHTHSYLPLSGGTMTGRLTANGKVSLPTTGGGWITGKTLTNAPLAITTTQTTNSYHPILAVQTSSGNVVNIGGLGDNVGFYGYKSDRTANGTDWSFTFNSSVGAVNSTGSITAPTFYGALSGNASTATKLQTARTITIGSKGKAFDGSANVSFTIDEIGALPKTGVTWNDLKGV